jgi:hypothetical protein
MLFVTGAVPPGAVPVFAFPTRLPAPPGSASIADWLRRPSGRFVHLFRKLLGFFNN